jgi:hypothetical protein
MKNDALDRLIRLAFLEGTIQTHGAWETNAARMAVRTHATPAVRQRLIGRLEAALGAPPAHDVLPETIGSYLRRTLGGKAAGLRSLATRLGLTEATVRLLEQDRISPVKVSAERWRAFMQTFSLGATEFAGMLLRTHQAVVFRPAVRTALARYRGGSTRGGKGGKSVALEGAAAELYTRAGVPLPPAEEKKIRKLIEEIGI